MSAPIAALDVRPGMVLPTVAGRGRVASVIAGNAQGRDRLTFLFDNGIVAANVRPWDTFTAPERSKP
jgi:hypothetical protein